MAKLKLVMNKGLPASGKTTNAKLLCEGGYYRVNKDDIRSMLFGEHYKRKHEKQVIWTRDSMIREALNHNKSVVVDDTNLNPIHEKVLKKIANEHNAEFVVNDSFLKVSVDECIKRDLKRSKSVGERVIREMYQQYILPDITKRAYKDGLSAAYIIDLDGTLAIMGDRSPFDWKKVGIDDINTGLSHIIDGINEIGYAKIFLFSGRDSACRIETEDWLDRHGIQYHLLAMRPKDDNRKDTEIKKELFNEHIEGKYNVLGVFDDRPVVAEQWRSMGLNVFQVGSPYIWF